MMGIKNVLIPTDFSDNSVHAFDFGLYIATQNSASLHLLHVVSSNSANALVYNSQVTDDNLHSKIMEAEEELRRFIAKIPPCNIEIIESLRVGDPVEEIISYSKVNSIDLISISSHGWSNHSHLPTGSVTSKILSLAEPQVICIKAHSHKPITSRARLRSTWAEYWVG